MYLLLEHKKEKRKKELQEFLLTLTSQVYKNERCKEEDATKFEVIMPLNNKKKKKKEKSESYTPPGLFSRDAIQCSSLESENNRGVFGGCQIAGFG